MKPREEVMMHLIFRRCEPEQFDDRRKDYEAVGLSFESAWFEGADSSDKYPHVHCIVYSQWAKKTLQDRLAKQFPQYSSQHVFKDVESSEYEGNVLDYVCKEWNPLITNENILAKYEIHRGCYAFKKNMKMLKKVDTKKGTLNERICANFEKYYKEKGGKVTDDNIIDWLQSEYKFLVKDLDSLIIRRKFWMLKNCFEIKDKYSLKKIIIRDLERESGFLK